MKKTFLYLTLMLFSGLMMVSCNKEQDTNLSKDEPVDEFFVSLEEATQIAGHLESFIKKEEGATGRSSNTARISDYDQVPDKEGKTSMYVFNYKNTGFLVLAADKRVEPLLAFSGDNEFVYNRDEMHPGLLEWMDEVREGVSEIRATDQPQTEENRQIWTDLSNPRRIEPIDENECEDWTIIKGPLLATTWNQWCTGFNDLVTTTCTGWCSRAPIGCVATAMSQVMRYHQHPSGYNYASMNNSWGGGDTPQLYIDVANAVDMDFDCDGSGASMSDARSALDNDFSYASAIYTGYNYSQVKTDIDYNRPVILAGYNSDAGHAWVCDGYWRWHTCIFDDYGNLITALTYLRLHMNWGWGGTFNGYYSFNGTWNPGGTTYNSNRKMIYRIIP